MGLAVPAMIEAGTEAQKKEALGAIAQGSARATLAFTEPSGKWDAASVTLTAKPSGGGWQLEGVKQFVPDAEAADYMVVAARTRGDGEDGISLFLVKGRPKGMTVSSLKTLDQTRRWSEVRFDGVKLDAGSLMGTAGKAWPQLKRALEWATAALCAEMVGGTQKVLEASTEYAKTRHQFGKAIGIYQAVSHKLADMLVLSKRAVGDLLRRVGGRRRCIGPLPGGVDGQGVRLRRLSQGRRRWDPGPWRNRFTWEHDMHLYFKRAKSSEVTLGDATYHRELVAQSLDL